MEFWDDAVVKNTPPTIEDIYRSPGHLIRRCQQISASVFADELGEFGLTPVQYASLLAIRDRPDIDQRSLGRMIAIDRSTIGTVMKGLEDRELITRTTPPNNLRIKVMRVTERGETLLIKSVNAIANVQKRLLAPLCPEDQKTLLRLLSQVVDVNNSQSRAPLEIKKEP
ncbi:MULTISPECIES: MarR family winged helix-turn-helix transcriptional regulator [Actibacterium]|uniref:DNA-binding MarR family transcriptional regulator n=1 Tax=Actibacterium naphthalenivorans TaxID=1614693 RepID=A0A840CLK9_9RHOB|nr:MULTISPECIES: MarR family winged helix-turn-helix transcriptional regulator [Actibacterium]ALG91489.1 hypothetical protein TQ29_16415 [Actibacterium sp. EMB200-NS6]MBB4022927.1 DNA-binding MarR family transcriptional regulator [Actibacterium naphthalenivorans]